MVTLLHDLESNETALGAACGAPPTRAGPTTVGARELLLPPWNGDQVNGNHIARLRYNTMYLEKIMARIAVGAPSGADVSSWRY